MANAANSPIAVNRLKQICKDACDSVLANATSYHHASTNDWNTTIINKTLQSLISESTTPPSASGDTKAPTYKFAVTSTIIQHLSDPRPTGTSESGVQTGADSESVSLGTDSTKKVGRRGMHSASGAFWNNEKDGMWAYKYDGGEGKGMDIVISVMWVAV